eukprot:9227000-Alexandrium_andersonii.AAC.1
MDSVAVRWSTSSPSASCTPAAAIWRKACQHWLMMSCMLRISSAAMVRSLSRWPSSLKICRSDMRAFVSRR